MVSRSTEKNTGNESLCHPEDSPQAGQVSIWRLPFSLHGINDEDHSGNHWKDEDHDVDETGEAQKASCKDDRGRGYHHSTQHGQPAAQISPVREEGSQEHLQLKELDYKQDQGHNDAENPDKLAPLSPWEHHPASEDDKDER